MRILHLLSQHPESTGSGFYIQNVIRQAESSGHQNYLLAGISNNQKPSLEAIKLEASSFLSFNSGELPFKIPGMSDVMPYPSSRFKDLDNQQLQAYETQWTLAIREAIENFRPTIIHSHHLWLVSGIARKICPGLPMVTSCHSTDLRQYVQCPHLREKVQQSCSTIDMVLALSLPQAKEIEGLLSIPQNKIKIIGGGFDESLFQMRAKPHPPPIELLYAGKLSFAKGVDWLLNTMTTLDTNNFHLHLAGSGAGYEEQQCLQLAGEQRKVTVHGRLDQIQLAGLMARCHLFILPSYFEGLPLVLLEALASGCRLITTDLPGCIELLGHSEQDLVDFIQLPPLETIDSPREKDRQRLEEQLAASIEKMAARVTAKPTPSAASIQRITSRYNWSAVFNRIENAYKKAGANGAV